jgi:hypothetical protein
VFTDFQVVRHKIIEDGGAKMPIENWTMSHEDIDKALELQTQIKEAGLNWPQLDLLLEMKRGTVEQWCRAHQRVPGPLKERIREILDGVKTGKITPPIVNKET